MNLAQIAGGISLNHRSRRSPCLLLFSPAPCMKPQVQPGVELFKGVITVVPIRCEEMSMYPRTYKFIHADSVFTLYQDRCEMEDILLEMDRVLRPLVSAIF